MSRGLICLLALGMLAPQGGEVEISASLNRQMARVGETVLLTVTLRAQGLRSPEIVEPELGGFEVVSRSDRSTFRYSATLGAVREFAREYTLRVVEAGMLTVPPIGVLIEGAEYETEALTLSVEEGGIADIPPALIPQPEEEVAVRLWVAPETAYVGQQITLTVGAFFDPTIRGRLQRQPEYRPPDVQGFWTADLPGSSGPERQVMGQREYFVQTYRRALFPLAAGELRIPPAAVLYEVRRGLIYAPETFQVESEPATVVVRPLPEEGVPADFSGAVGQFDVQVWFDRSDLRAGEAVNLVLEVTGSGNLSSLARPPLPQIPGLRSYEGGEDAVVRLQGSEFAGHKRFSWVLVPEQPGEHLVPELRLAYFDPRQSSYVVTRTEPMTLLVEPGSSAAIASSSGTAAIRFIKTRTGRSPFRFAGRTGFWLLQAVPLLALALSLGIGRFRRRAPTLERGRVLSRRRLIRSLRPLAAASDSTFFGLLRVAVVDWLAARLHQPDLAKYGVVQVQHSLEDAGVPPPVALEVIELLERCGRYRYAPEPPSADIAGRMLANADRLLGLVDREAVSERGLRASAGATRSAVLLVLFAVTVQPSSAGYQERGAARLFQDGVAAYGRGDYTRAVDLFRIALEERPGDPNLLYNLGNAHYELDEVGRAAAHWIRSLRLRPRDDDARYNLSLAVGDDPVIGSALPPLPLSSDELAVLFTLLWYAGWAAVLLHRRRRRAYFAFVGGTAIVLALFVAALLVSPRADYAIVVNDEAPLRKGPVRGSESIARVSDGTGFRVREQRSDWLRVSRGAENEGWIELVDVELID